MTPFADERGFRNIKLLVIAHSDIITNSFDGSF